MADNKSNRPEDAHQDDKGYTPASPVKRTLAWIALAYVLIFLALTTYFFYTGAMLGNLAPLLTIPGLIGMGALAVVSHKSTGSPRLPVTIGLALACWALAAFTLPIGIMGLLSNFGR